MDKKERKRLTFSWFVCMFGLGATLAALVSAEAIYQRWRLWMIALLGLAFVYFLIRFITTSNRLAEISIPKGEEEMKLELKDEEQDIHKNRT